MESGQTSARGALVASARAQLIHLSIETEGSLIFHSPVVGNEYDHATGLITKLDVYYDSQVPLGAWTLRFLRDHLFKVPGLNMHAGNIIFRHGITELTEREMRLIGELCAGAVAASEGS